MPEKNRFPAVLQPVAFSIQTLQAKNPMAVAIGLDEEQNAMVDGFEGSVMQSMQVRRLTPRECERLQGFPDGYTLVSHRGKPAADGPRYKAIGNSWAVPVVRWIGRRIEYSLAGIL